MIKYSINNLPGQHVNNGEEPGDFSTAISKLFNESQTFQLEPSMEMEFLGLTLTTVDMTLYPPEVKIKNITSQCKKMLLEKITNLRELASLISKLISTYQASLLELNSIAKEALEFFTLKKITMIVEYLPSTQKTQPYWESRTMKDWNKWKLCIQVFAKVAKLLG